MIIKSILYMCYAKGGFEHKGVRFVFVLVGVPDRVLVPIPVKFDRSPM